MISELMILVDIKLKSNSFILESLFQIVATPFFPRQLSSLKSIFLSCDIIYRDMYLLYRDLVFAVS